MVPDIKALHIETTNICTLKCPSCSRTDFINSPYGKYWKNQNLNYQDLDQFLDIDLTDITLSLCGNYGDPIYYTKLFDFVKTFKKRDAIIKLTTNGSHKTSEWWDELCSLLDPAKDRVIFSIDGIPENFTKYRINGDWKSIKSGINSCVNRGISTSWKYIVFQYNVDNINEAKQLATSLGVNNFSTEKSWRYDQFDDFRPPEEYINSKFFAQQEDTKQIDPRCALGNDHYISANGYYSPCCYVAEHRFYYKTQFGKDRRNYNIKDTTISQLLSNKDTVKFYDSINNMKLDACTFQCPKISRNT